MSLTDALIATLIMSGVTLFTRAVPFVFFRTIKPPEWLLFIEKYLPPVMMTILVFYSIKDVAWFTSPFGLPEIIGILLVVILHLWKRNPLISIFGGTIVYMILVQTVFM